VCIKSSTYAHTYTHAYIHIHIRTHTHTHSHTHIHTHKHMHANNCTRSQVVGLEMDLPVIMISGNGDTETVLRGVTHGAVRVCVLFVYVWL